jgi:hypothetical protein
MGEYISHELPLRHTVSHRQGLPDPIGESESPILLWKGDVHLLDDERQVQDATNWSRTAEKAVARIVDDHCRQTGMYPVTEMI